MTSFKPMLYITHIDELKDLTLYNRAYSAVSDLRRCKTDRLCKTEDKCLGIASELLLQKGLFNIGHNSRNLDFIIKNGKPYLKEYPNIFFNISHSSSIAICAVAPFNIGCDIEKIKPVDFQIAKRFFTKNEYETIINQVDLTQKTDMFYRLWTLKESFLKAIGLGLKLPLNEFEINIGEEVSITQNVDKNQYRFVEYNIEKGYKCAVCSVFCDTDIPTEAVCLKQLLS